MKKIVTLRKTLIEMRWPQPPSPLQTDNSTASGITNNTIVPRQTKDTDMRFYWLYCRSTQDQFRFIGTLGDSTGVTIAPSMDRHCTMRPTNIPKLSNPCLPHILLGFQSRDFSPLFIFLFTSTVTRLPFLL